MKEWPNQMEQCLNEIQFPGPEIALSTGDYARVMAAMLKIPVHKTSNDKGLIEAMYQMFTLYSDFTKNQHLMGQQER